MTTDDVFVPLGGFGSAMKAARKARGWTQKLLAEYADVDPETIIRIEQGLNTRTSTMEKIRKVLPDIAGSNGQLSAQQLEAQRQIDAAEERKAFLEATREQVIHLVRAIPDLEHLQRIRHFALRQLTDAELTPPPKPTKKARRPAR